MPHPILEKYLGAFVRAYRQLSSSAAFALLNGLIISLGAYFLLYFISLDLRDQQAREISRDIYAVTEKAVIDTEKNLRSLSYLYASVQGSGGPAAAPQQARRQLLADGRFAGLLWVTSHGTWHYEDLLRNVRYTQYSPVSGLPNYQDLYRATYGTSENAVVFINQMPWLATKSAQMALPVSRMALTVKTRLPDGGQAFLFALAVPARLFALDNLSQHSDVLSVTVSDIQAAQEILQIAPNTAAAGGFESLTAKYPLMIWNRYGEITFQMSPSIVSRIIALIPWAAVIIITLVTLGIAFALDRKHMQDRKLAEMSKTLAGAHTELKHSQSEKEKLFQTLRKSERENRAVLNSVSDIIFETDETGKILFLNETWKRVSGREIEEGIGQSLFAMIDPAERARQRDMFEELVRGERQAYRSETRIDTGSHVLKPVEIAFSMLRMAEDKTLRVVGTMTDIEKRRRAEIAVREAEQRYRAMFENATSGIYQSSLEGRYINVNPSMAEILGYSSAQDLMDSVEDIGLDIHVDPHAFNDFNQKLLFEGRVSGVVSQVKRKDGRVIWIMENARVVRNDRGGIHYFEGSVIDITETKLAEEAMRQARIQAEMSSRSRMEFLANMSHELRTPLNAIIGFSEIIKDEVMGEHHVPVYKEYAQDIYNSGNYLLKVISEILEVSKIESGNRELNINPFRLKKAVNSCLTIMAGRVEDAKLTLEQDIAADLPDLLAEELAFKQIILNLLSNAVKFTPEGGKIKLSAALNEEGQLEIDVIDTGIGMTEDEIVKALQPFSKVDNNFGSMKEGTGLGLTIVESLVRLHGGEFTLISEKGQGTTARITLPKRCLFRPETTAAAS
jgi:PAS domain S-box-containing protein